MILYTQRVTVMSRLVYAGDFDSRTSRQQQYYSNEFLRNIFGCGNSSYLTPG